MPVTKLGARSCGMSPAALRALSHSSAAKSPLSDPDERHQIAQFVVAEARNGRRQLGVRRGVGRLQICRLAARPRGN